MGFDLRWQCVGATLIEVVAVLAIMAVIVSMGALGLVGVRDRQAVQITAIHIEDEVRQLQSRALSQGYAWRLVISPDKTSYELVRASGCGASTFGTPTKQQPGYPIPSGVTVEASAVPSQITFECTGRRDPMETEVELKVAAVVAGQEYGKSVFVSAVAGQVTVR